MEVTARGGRVAEARERHPPLAALLVREGGADGERDHVGHVRHLARDVPLAAADVEVAVLAAGRRARLAHELGEDPPHGHAVDEVGAEIADPGREPVAVLTALEREGDADGDRLLAAAGVVAAGQLALAIQVERPLLDAARQRHPVVQVEREVVGDLDRWQIGDSGDLAGGGRHRRVIGRSADETSGSVVAAPVGLSGPATNIPTAKAADRMAEYAADGASHVLPPVVHRRSHPRARLARPGAADRGRRRRRNRGRRPRPPGDLVRRALRVGRRPPRLPGPLRHHRSRARLPARVLGRMGRARSSSPPQPCSRRSRPSRASRRS